MELRARRACIPTTEEDDGSENLEKLWTFGWDKYSVDEREVSTNSPFDSILDSNLYLLGSLERNEDEGEDVDLVVVVDRTLEWHHQ